MLLGVARDRRSKEVGHAERELIWEAMYGVRLMEGAKWALEQLISSSLVRRAFRDCKGLVDRVGEFLHSALAPSLRLS